MKLKSVLSPASIAIWQKLAGEEMYAHLLYTHISNQLQAIGYFGAQKYFEGEADSEFSHYKKIRNFLNDVGSVLSGVPSYQINDEVNDLTTALELYYNAEVALLGKYVAAYKDMDDAENMDCVSEPLMLEFIEIQRTSIGEAGDLYKRFEIAKESGEILLFDNQIGK